MVLDQPQEFLERAIKGILYIGDLNSGVLGVLYVLGRGQGQLQLGVGHATQQLNALGLRQVLQALEGPTRHDLAG